MAGGDCRDSVKRLLVHVLSQTPVVVRHREEVGEAVSLLATEFRENQVHSQSVAVADCRQCCNSELCSLQGELKFELCSVFYSVLSAVGQVSGNVL